MYRSGRERELRLHHAAQRFELKEASFGRRVRQDRGGDCARDDAAWKEHDPRDSGGRDDPRDGTADVERLDDPERLAG